METVNVVTDEVSNSGSEKSSEEIPKAMLPLDPSSRTKLNHPLEFIVGNMNELTLRKRIVDKCVINFVSYLIDQKCIDPL